MFGLRKKTRTVIVVEDQHHGIFGIFSDMDTARQTVTRWQQLFQTTVPTTLYYTEYILDYQVERLNMIGAVHHGRS